MILEENKQYIANNGKRVVIGSTTESMNFYYQQEIINILEINVLSYEDKVLILKDHHIVFGLIEDLMTPSGYRHKESGTCLGLNISLTGDKLENLLRGYDIEHKEKEIN